MFLTNNQGLGGVQVLTRDTEKFFVDNSGHSLETQERSHLSSGAKIALE